MEKLIFHGSPKIVKRPFISWGKENNDFGQGFYCTESLDYAKEWACFHRNNGYANSYTLDIDGLNIVDLTTSDYNVLHWISTLCKYRVPTDLDSIAEENRQYLLENYPVDLSKADIVVGYRADDSYFSYARTFLDGNMPIPVLSKALQLGNLGTQIMLKTQHVCDRLHFNEAILADFNTYGIRAINRDRLAREKYDEMRKDRKFFRKGLTLNDIIDQGVDKNDSRLSQDLPWRSHEKSWGLL